MIDPVVQKVSVAALALERREWEQGTLAQAFLELGDEETAFALARGSLVFARDDGSLGVRSDAAPADSAMLGEAIWRAATATGDTILAEAEGKLRHWILEGAPRASDGTIFHVGSEMYVDSHHCAAPYLAVVGDFDAALGQLAGLRRRLWNDSAQLFHFRWDDSIHDFVDGGFWGVGNGWAAAGLTRVVRALPAGRVGDRNLVVAHLRALLDGCLRYQRADGLFHNYLDQADTFVETNCGQMLAFAIYTGVFGGWLPENLLDAADRIRAAVRNKVDEFGFVRDVCGAPNFDHPGIATEGQAFFMMMEAAASRLQRPMGV